MISFARSKPAPGSEQRTNCHPNLYHPEPMQLFHNNGDGTFTQVTGKHGTPLPEGKQMGIAVADFAGDHRIGLAIL